MSEQATEANEAAEQQNNEQVKPAQPPAGVSADAWDALGDPGKKAITAEREAREAAERSAAEYQAQLSEIEKSNLSEIERAKREAEEARSELESAKAAAAKARIQARHGISDDLAATFLTASTEDELEAQAKALAELVADRKKQGNRAPFQGQTPASTQGGDERETVRSLFGSGG